MSSPSRKTPTRYKRLQSEEKANLKNISDKNTVKSKSCASVKGLRSNHPDGDFIISKEHSSIDKPETSRSDQTAAITIGDSEKDFNLECETQSYEFDNNSQSKKNKSNFIKEKKGSNYEKNKQLQSQNNESIDISIFEQPTLISDDGIEKETICENIDKGLQNSEEDLIRLQEKSKPSDKIDESNKECSIKKQENSSRPNLDNVVKELDFNEKEVSVTKLETSSRHSENLNQRLVCKLLKYFKFY